MSSPARPGAAEGPWGRSRQDPSWRTTGARSRWGHSEDPSAARRTAPAAAGSRTAASCARRPGRRRHRPIRGRAWPSGRAAGRGRGGTGRGACWRLHIVSAYQIFGRKKKTRKNTHKRRVRQQAQTLHGRHLDRPVGDAQHDERLCIVAVQLPAPSTVREA